MFRARKLKVRLSVENATNTGVVLFLVCFSTRLYYLQYTNARVFFLLLARFVCLSVCLCVLIRSITLTLSIIARKTASAGERGCTRPLPLEPWVDRCSSNSSPTVRRRTLLKLRPVVTPVEAPPFVVELWMEVLLGEDEIVV